jgi:hypothetical protein
MFKSLNPLAECRQIAAKILEEIDQSAELLEGSSWIWNMEQLCLLMENNPGEMGTIMHEGKGIAEPASWGTLAWTLRTQLAFFLSKVSEKNLFGADNWIAVEFADGTRKTIGIGILWEEQGTVCLEVLPENCAPSQCPSAN